MLAVFRAMVSKTTLFVGNSFKEFNKGNYGVTCATVVVV